MSYENLNAAQKNELSIELWKLAQRKTEENEAQISSYNLLKVKEPLRAAQGMRSFGTGELKNLLANIIVLNCTAKICRDFYAEKMIRHGGGIGDVAWEKKAYALCETLMAGKLYQPK